jgi:hypothetical protein
MEHWIRDLIEMFQDTEDSAQRPQVPYLPSREIFCLPRPLSPKSPPEAP